MSDTNTTLPTFYICPICGNLVEMIDSSGQPLICCGVEMKLLDANSTDGALEKHVPVVECDCGKVKVCIGSQPHPMTSEHHIEWVELVTDRGIQRKAVYPKEEPVICFRIGKHETPVTAYAYCNLHGLWRNTK